MPPRSIQTPLPASHKRGILDRQPGDLPELTDMLPPVDERDLSSILRDRGHRLMMPIINHMTVAICFSSDLSSGRQQYWSIEIKCITLILQCNFIIGNADMTQ